MMGAANNVLLAGERITALRQSVRGLRRDLLWGQQVLAVNDEGAAHQVHPRAPAVGFSRDRRAAPRVKPAAAPMATAAGARGERTRRRRAR